MYMGKLLDKEREKNIDKIKVGACLELTFLFDRFENDIEKIKEFITDNSKLLNNQKEYTINKNFDDIQCILDNNVDMILADIDKTEEFCKFHSKYY